jgi:hypothetical protein
MVAPGHCSPSRKVVSKMTTRSFSDEEAGDWLMKQVLLDCAAAGAQWVRPSIDPLSAQAQMPSRPSGAGKEKERAQNEGGSGPSLCGSPNDRADIVPRGHLRQNPHRAGQRR